PVPVLTAIQQFAATIAAPAIEVLRQSSARAEAIYCEIDGRLRNDASADLRWFRAAAIGEVLAPGIDGIRALLGSAGGRFRFDDAECLASIASATDDLLIFGDRSSPLERYSGIAALKQIVADLEKLTESEIVERVIDAGSRQRLIFAVVSGD